MLLVHADSFEYKVTSKAIDMAEPLSEHMKEGMFKELLVVFTTIEKGDGNLQILKSAVSNVKDVADKIGVKSVLIYPYAHLSSNLAEPDEALKVLKLFEESLKEEGFTVYRSPFGWYKSFKLSCKGHPLAELSRSITTTVETEESEKAEGPPSKLREFHRFIVMDVDGSTYEVNVNEWRNCSVFKKEGKIYRLLETFIRNEIEGNPPKKKPKHIEYMRRLELVDYCPESDVGNMKFYSNGVLIADLIRDYALFKVALPWGAMKIQNPLIYRESVKEIRELMGEFHERDYRMSYGGENFVLRFASDPGAFPFMQKTVFSYRHLPVKIYEEVQCFRREKSGEVVGLRRLRSFTMTDQHCFCRDEEQAKGEFRKLCIMFKDLMNMIAPDSWVMGWEGVEWFYEENKEWLRSLTVEMGVPAFFKLSREMSHYYAIKNEYQVIGADEANVQIATVQYDIKNGERFQIMYTGEDGKRHPCIIIHASSFGSIERTLYALLEVAAKMEEEGRPPMLPVWLSPEQVRLIPVAERHLASCNEIADILEKSNIRVGIDDRELSVARKVRDAKTRWVPFIVVIGDKEHKTGKLPVGIRDKCTQKD
ncbi:MAG: threonine--tRNA ligase, partial [Candidatus Bathyarchaeia archaeon]